MFPNELEKNKDLSAEELNKIFQNKFPREVVEDQATMNVLTTLSQRIDKLTNRWYSKKYKHVADKAIECLDAFFSWKPKPDLPDNKILEERIKFLTRYVANLPKNEEIRYYLGLILDDLSSLTCSRDHLLDMGYSLDLFWSTMTMNVTIDDKENILENFKSELR